MWPDAYLEQARSDWKVWDLLKRQEIQSCHIIHYLQMTSEKLAKAFLLSSGTIKVEKVQRTHLAFRRFLQVAARNAALQELLGMTSAQLRSHIAKMIPIADTIERLSPALAEGGPNVEYPWQSPDHTIQIPTQFDFYQITELQKPGGVNMVKFIQKVLDKFYYLFKK